MRRARLIVAGATLVSLIGACSDSSEPPPESVDLATSTTAAVERDSVNGRLRIGLLLPRPGDSALGEGVLTAAQLAVRQINDSGGVLDRRVVILTEPEGATAADTQRAFDRLDQSDVDAVVGPTSSLNTLSELGTMVESGVVTCSPTASSILLDEFPDDGLFFRTVASDSLQAVALADQAENTGAATASIVYIDDAYGRGLSAALETELGRRTIAFESTAIRSGDESLRADAAAVLSAGSGVVIVLGDSTDGARILAAMGDVLDRNEEVAIPEVLVNDGVRDVNPDLIAELAPELRAAIVGVGPTVTQVYGGEPPGLFATNSYDCVTAIALAAKAAGSDDPGDIAAAMGAVTNDGSSCNGFKQCGRLLDAGLQIDYDGPGRSLDLAADGDPSQARFDLFVFNAEGLDEKEQTVTATQS